MVGLLPAYGRSPDNKVFAIGGMTADWNSKIKITWSNINSDAMRPAKTKETGETNPNLPHVDGRYAKFGDHIDDFISGFEDYAKFLLRQSRDAKQGGLFDGFAGACRPQGHSADAVLLHAAAAPEKSSEHGRRRDVVGASRLHRPAGGLGRDDSDPLWPLQRAERSALLALNVPHFVSPSDGNAIRDATGISIQTRRRHGSGSRARSRCGASTSRRSPGRSRSSGRTQARSAISQPTRRSAHETGSRTRTLRSRRAKRSSSRKPTGSPPSCPPCHPPGAGRGVDRSRLAGGLPRCSSSCASVPISTTACPASRCFSPRMRR